MCVCVCVCGGGEGGCLCVHVFVYEGVCVVCERECVCVYMCEWVCVLSTMYFSRVKKCCRMQNKSSIYYIEREKKKVLIFTSLDYCDCC